jgi:hypothetical protein
VMAAGMHTLTTAAGRAGMITDGDIHSLYRPATMRCCLVA